jgi:hypothetical protein
MEHGIHLAGKILFPNKLYMLTLHTVQSHKKCLALF